MKVRGGVSRQPLDEQNSTKVYAAGAQASTALLFPPTHRAAVLRTMSASAALMRLRGSSVSMRCSRANASLSIRWESHLGCVFSDALEHAAAFTESEGAATGSQQASKIKQRMAVSLVKAGDAHQRLKPSLLSGRRPLRLMSL